MKTQFLTSRQYSTHTQRERETEHLFTTNPYAILQPLSYSKLKSKLKDHSFCPYTDTIQRLQLNVVYMILNVQNLQNHNTDQHSTINKYYRTWSWIPSKNTNLNRKKTGSHMLNQTNEQHLEARTSSHHNRSGITWTQIPDYHLEDTWCLNGYQRESDPVGGIRWVWVMNVTLP